MIEAYAFLAAFALQILVVSVLNTARFIRYARGWSAHYGSERFAQLYPHFDYDRWIEGFVTVFRTVNHVIAVVGLLLLGWLFTVTQRPDWTGAAMGTSPLYLMVQLSPLALLALYTALRFHKVFLQSAHGAKRSASLQRRGLLDFVSPLTVTVAALSFLLFFPFAVYVDLHVYGNATVSKYCYRAMAGVTFVYAMNGFIVYKMLYGRKNPFVSHEGRVRNISIAVKSSVYGSIAVVWFVVASSFVTKLNLENWRPFAMTIFMVTVMLISSKDLTAPLSKTEGDESAA